MPPPAVDVVTLKSETLELKDTLAGRVSAFRTAEIRPQVNGIILKRFFDEGATVKAGDKLYQIDPSLYQAALASAEAQLTVAEANAYAARLKAKRYKELSKKSAISAQEVDDSEAAAKQADAQVKAAQAEVRSAKVNLGYTEITAPISGVIGRSTITEGALVSAQQATALTTIRQLTPIYVDIQRPAASLMRMKNPSLSRNVTVELDDGTPYADVGELQFADVSVDQGTGTVNVRAQFENKDALLLPGMFVRANVPSALIENAILVPQQAIVRQANATTTAYVLDDANVVSLRGVEVTRAIGDKWLVKVGLNAGDRVIISGLQKVKPGITVAPEEAKP
ncbi:MAG: efflux transporter periplasmic adaptor subunit [Oceanospirillaceae bacterium]|nr:efflux transporter periplasmic adaptor subunit [Oceanospirillaceae bacterium]